MKIMLLTPQDNTTLGVIGGYCKKALEYLGNDVSVFDFRKSPYPENNCISYLRSIKRKFFPESFSPSLIPGLKSLIDQKINSTLLDSVFNYNPDLLLVLLGENIFPQTIEKIKKMGVVCANWIFDTLLSPHRQALLRSVASCYDYLFIIDSLSILRYLDINPKHIETIPLACDPEVHKRVSLSQNDIKKYGSDISFIGTMTPERERVLKGLASFDLKIWGRWDRKSGVLKKCYQKKDVYREEAVKIYNASKITLDIHGFYPREKEIFNVTPRVFEVPASGGFLLTNYASQLENFYKVGEEIIAYKNTEELFSLARYYLDHVSQRGIIAEKSYKRAQGEHTYSNRLKQLLGCIKKL